MFIRLQWRPQLRRALRPSYRLISNATRPFAESDLVLLRPKNDRTAVPLLRGPLKPGRNVETHRGVIPHEAIIGKSVRDVVSSKQLKSGKRGAEFRLAEVKLEEYARLSRRIVTPIYPADANLIVSLLDLHPEVYDPELEGEDAPKLEILEAGTGHGALTLYLSRAVHGANPHRPKRPSEDSTEAEEEAHTLALEVWKSKRRAIIHTIEIAPRHSSHAQSVISAFKHGMYASNIDFHVGDVSEWLQTELATRGSTNQPFLDHAFLDLPNTDAHMGNVAQALRTDGSLIVFNPSITQITECALRVKKEGWPLELEKVVELGVNGGSGGREWDVRPVKLRPGRKVDVEGAGEGEVSADQVSEAEDSRVEIARDEEQALADGAKGEEVGEVMADPEEEKWSVICRPKVGDRIVGGGFLGVFKKQTRI